MTDDAAERAKLTNRLTTLAQAAGLKVKSADDLTTAAIEAGVSIHFNAIEPDEQITDKLLLLSAKRHELFEQPASPPPVHSAGLPADFAKSLGGLAADWDKLPPMRKLQLWDRHCAATGTKARMPSTAQPAAAAYTRPVLVDIQREASRVSAELQRLREDRSIGGMREQAMRAQRISTLEAKLTILKDRGAAA